MNDIKALVAADAKTYCGATIRAGFWPITTAKRFPPGAMLVASDTGFTPSRTVRRWVSQCAGCGAPIATDSCDYCKRPR